MYIYPDNLKSKATLWFWELKDIAIIGIALVISVTAFSKLGIILPLVVTASYGFLTIRFDDTTILKFICNAYNYFIGVRQLYEWSVGDE